METITRTPSLFFLAHAETARGSIVVEQCVLIKVNSVHTLLMNRLPSYGKHSHAAVTPCKSPVISLLN